MRHFSTSQGKQCFDSIYFQKEKCHLLLLSSEGGDTYLLGSSVYCVHASYKIYSESIYFSKFGIHKTFALAWPCTLTLSIKKNISPTLSLLLLIKLEPFGCTEGFWSQELTFYYTNLSAFSYIRIADIELYHIFYKK